MGIRQVFKLTLIFHSKKMNNNETTKHTVEAWADIVVKEWLKKARAMEIHEGHLLTSFMSHVISNSDGDPTRVHFAFAWYGNMVNWGVGKGVSIKDRDTMISAGLTSRRPKPIISDVFYKQLAILRYLLEEKGLLNMEKLIVQTATK